MVNKGGVKLSVIIVYFGERESLIGLLKSFFKHKPKQKFEIIIVNNKAGENISGILKKYKYLRLIESGADLGYGNGNNLGFKYSKGEYIFIINPDTLVRGNTPDRLIKFLDKNPDAGIVAPNLIHTDGRIFENIGTSILTPLKGIFALSFLNKVFPDNPVSRDYYLKDLPKNKVREVGTVPGTAFMIRSSIYKKLHGFDKNFFLFFEELDLCKRVHEAGWNIYIDPKAEVVHDWEPQEKTPDSKYYKESRFYYFKKNFGLFNALVVEIFARLSKKNAIILSVILFAYWLIFLR